METPKATVQTSKKKKNKGKRKSITFFRGPKRSHPLPVVNEDDGKRICNLFIELLQAKPYLKLYNVKRLKRRGKSKGNLPENEPRKADDAIAKSQEKELSSQEPSEEIKTADKTQETSGSEKLSDSVIFGLNAVIRGIEKKVICGVILTSPLAIHIQQNILDLCQTNDVPCICISQFDHLSNAFGISCLSSLAFKTAVSQSKESSCHDIYLEFANLAAKFRRNNDTCEAGDETVETPNRGDLSRSVSGVAKSEKSDVGTQKMAKVEMPLNDILYFKIPDKKDSLLRTFLTRQDANTNDDIKRQAPFLAFSKKEDQIFFPNRPADNHKIDNLRILIKSNDETRKQDGTFIESLMDISIKSDQRTEKRKLTASFDSKSSKNKKLKLKEVDVVHVEPKLKQKTRKAKRQENRSKKKDNTEKKKNNRGRKKTKKTFKSIT